MRAAIADAAPPRFLRLRDVKDRTALSSASIYRFMDRGEFPRSVQIGPNCVRWLEAEVDGWVIAKAGRGRVPAATPSENTDRV